LRHLALRVALTGYQIHKGGTVPWSLSATPTINLSKFFCLDVIFVITSVHSKLLVCNLTDALGGEFVFISHFAQCGIGVPDFVGNVDVAKKRFEASWTDTGPLEPFLEVLEVVILVEVKRDKPSSVYLLPSLW
jgi:hypothetical protein